MPRAVDLDEQARLGHPVVDGPLEVHTHNDFGMAVAGSLAAVVAGAQVVHVCVNGLGERTGNAPLEEVAVAARVLLGLDIGIDLPRLKELSALVEQLAGVPLARNKPVVGEDAFAREVGLGIELVKTQQRTVFPFVPGLVGMEPRVVIGKKSRVRSITMKLDEWGLEASEEQMRVMLAKVKQMAIDDRRPLTDVQVRRIYEEVLAGRDGTGLQEVVARCAATAGPVAETAGAERGRCRRRDPLRAARARHGRRASARGCWRRGPLGPAVDPPRYPAPRIARRRDHRRCGGATRGGRVARAH